MCGRRYARVAERDEGISTDHGSALEIGFDISHPSRAVQNFKSARGRDLSRQNRFQTRRFFALRQRGESLTLMSAMETPKKPTPAGKPRMPRLPASTPTLTGRFAALDFETADFGRDSACALSVVIVDNERVVDTWTSLIRPPRRSFEFTYLHGISWAQVKDKPVFGELWPAVAQLLATVDFIAAHNASFDRSVLRACCEGAGHEPVTLPFLCTVKLARAAWDIFPTTLSDVAHHLQIPLKHHDAASDAFACAQILIKAREKGHGYADLVQKHTLKPARPRA